MSRKILSRILFKGEHSKQRYFHSERLIILEQHITEPNKGNMIEVLLINFERRSELEPILS